MGQHLIKTSDLLPIGTELALFFMCGAVPLLQIWEGGGILL